SRLPHEDKSIWLEFILPHLSPEQKLVFFDELSSSSWNLENYTESFKVKKHMSGSDPKEFQRLIKDELEQILSEK
ncbi:hypothetical protein M1506_03545, partial [Patescibacteria group bacterium]|nr:hypothetical protein [Patescibacteria group bacterium]MCL4400320.1 hypothetical protein [Patescibacteria group bacterium]